jgi:TM2 domain-containing membrane protein YozV
MATVDNPYIGVGRAVAALVLNVVVWPGLGSLVGDEIGIGLAQGFLFLFGVGLTLSLIGAVIGIPVCVAIWIWGIVSGARLIERAHAFRRADPLAPLA